jgi:hypothetical protein
MVARIVPLQSHSGPLEDALFERSVHAADGRSVAPLRRVQALLSDEERIACALDGRRLVLAAEQEADLHRLAEVLQDAFGDALRVGPIAVHRRRGARGVEVPVLCVQVRCAPRQVDAVRRDLQRRGGTIVEADGRQGFGVVRATVPATHMLGYARQLAAMTAGSAHRTAWLSHHLPDDDDPIPA